MLAPAKINLGLRVTGVREDGYHELESLFLPLDLADELEVELRDQPGVALELEGAAPDVPGDARNLAVRAAAAFLEAAGLEAGVRIRLHKQIPSGAGLGGGSSDAAAVLRALEGLRPGRLAPERLAELALGLGADVPWFLDPRPAAVSGIGERIEPMMGFPGLALLLLNPGIPVSTAEVYRARDALAGALTASPPGSTMRPLAVLREAGGRIDRVDAAELGAWVANDLEAAATRLCPPIARLRARLRDAGALAVGLSGSGPTLYGIFPDRTAAGRAETEAGFRKPLWSRVAETLSSL
ncbi:MAG: 4-(cytidine 5'-diphospho)-2-C-methyl-D-erythritol kinase [Deltaproteobacteria bacterium]|nr:4-(cytidine 5'-diphospho)-2-C-methyl-D-erythritol kinase [Deltaproteobacteria bacterium]